MSLIQSVLRRLARRIAPARPPILEVLESRKLLSGSPALINMQVIGPIHDVNRVVLTFDESLDPTTAQQRQSYIFGRIPPTSPDSGITVGDVLGFLSRPRAKPIKSGKIQWSSAAYDDTTHSVTLTAIKPFNAPVYFRLLRVKGKGNYAIKDMSGASLNGGNDTLVHWTYHNGKALRYIDQDGDAVTITLKGPGHLYGFFRKTGDPDPTIFVASANSKSVLTGSVRQGRTGDAVAHIAQLLGAPTHTNLFGNSHFVVQGT